MMRLPDTALPAATVSELGELTAQVVAHPSHPARVEHAAILWQRKNRADNKTFRLVRSTAFAMCSGPQRCGWCEDSCADELDHIQPKYHYPERAFVWLNLIAACGTCNSPKGDAAAVFDDPDGHIWTTLTRTEPPQAPPPGEAVLVNPRIEDPLAFLELDLGGTFAFGPHIDADPRASARAQFTIDALRLNQRAYLVDARRRAFESFRDILSAAVIAHEDGDADEVAVRRRSIGLQGHPTVWAEMKRQRAFFPKLANLFDRLPEALGW